MLAAVALLQATDAAAAPPAAAHPALWTVHGKSGTVMLLGSIQSTA
ncbi:MAG: hypothetical protein WDM81_13540 [Rhizomicrobium sp.]